MQKINLSGYFYSGLEDKYIYFNEVGTKKNNIIHFKKDNDTITLLTNENHCTFIKKNNDSKLKYTFDKLKNNDSYYNTYKYNTKIYLKILTKDIKIHDNTIDIKFELEEKESEMYISYETNYNVSIEN